MIGNFKLSAVVTPRSRSSRTDSDLAIHFKTDTSVMNNIYHSYKDTSLLKSLPIIFTSSSTYILSYIFYHQRILIIFSLFNDQYHLYKLQITVP